MGGEVDYAAIREDYEFFLAHSTETAAQVAALAPHLTPPPASMLDFGCGTGAFTGALLSACPAPAMALSLVEPVAEHRAEAAARLAPMVGRLAATAGTVEDLGAGRYELILANHSLYYVSDIVDTLDALLRRRGPQGRLVLALLDRATALARLWQAGFAAIGTPFPFPLAEDAEAALVRRGHQPRREAVAYRVDFPDTPENRLKVLRFLFGSHLERLGRDDALTLFDRHRRGGRVVIETAYPHLVV